jgi:hypothetical protein
MLRYIVTVRFLAGENGPERERKARLVERIARMCCHRDGLRLEGREGHGVLVSYLEFHFPQPESARRLRDELVRHRPVWAELEEEVEARG